MVFRNVNEVYNNDEMSNVEEDFFDFCKKIDLSELCKQVDLFTFCKQIDLYVDSNQECLEPIVSVALEHGFRGISVSSIDIENVAKLIGEDDCIPICILDAPFGDSSRDIRAYSVKSAREKGAKEVEILAPYKLILNEEYKLINDDLQNLISAANSVNVGLRYVVYADKAINDQNITKFCRIMSALKLDDIAIDIRNAKTSYADSILQMRNFKTKTSCGIKTYLSNCSQEELCSCVKAGTDTIGIDWKYAPNIIHEYEELIQKSL